MNCHDRDWTLLFRSLLLRLHRDRVGGDRLETPGIGAEETDRGCSFRVGQTLDRAGRGEICAVRDGERHRHSSAGRKTGYIAAIWVDLELSLDLERDLVQVLDLAGTFVNMLIEKKTPAIRVSQTIIGGDEGVDHDEIVALCQILESRLIDHVDFGLAAAVQDHHQWHRVLPRVGGRHKDLVLAIARSRVRFGHEQLLPQFAGRGGAAEQPANSNCQQLPKDGRHLTLRYLERWQWCDADF